MGGGSGDRVSGEGRLHFAVPSWPSGWTEENLHLRTVEHAQYTKMGRPEGRPRNPTFLRLVSSTLRPPPEGPRRRLPSRRWPCCGHRTHRRRPWGNRKPQ